MYVCKNIYISIYIYIYIDKISNHWSNELSVRQWSGRTEFILRCSHTKDTKNGT